MSVSKLKTIDAPVGAEIVIDGRRYINFGGSSYLGLSAIPEVLEAGRAALMENGSGYQFVWPYQIATRAIRCGIFADHKPAHMDALIDALRRLL